MRQSGITTAHDIVFLPDPERAEQITHTDADLLYEALTISIHYGRAKAASDIAFELGRRGEDRP